ncbi:MAG: pheT [Candidatus Midichloriaceae bacterium]|jgi:phenylalanyl-tRNA synthetase beta chain|nr:pheT [Candidatus Midichloriaceae bacterium]
MRFTLSWLKKHLNTTSTLEQICKTLTSIGLEVEECIDKSKVYEPFIIAEILKAEPHPDADKLRVCTVFDGNANLQIVCGASNARAGIKVVLAPIGTVIPAGNFVIKAAKIRGVESSGMLCSSEELMLPGASEGIIELPADAKVGLKYMEYAKLDDAVIEIALTPNRGDAACVLGIARDLAAAGLGNLISPTSESAEYKRLLAKPASGSKMLEDFGAQDRSVLDIHEDPSTKSTPQIAAEVGLCKKSKGEFPINIEDKDNCQEFTATVVKGVDNYKSTPEYIGNMMRAIGSSPKSALVDISNFAMFDMGRPNHMYDLDKIKGSVTVRKSRKDEKFIALGGQEYALPADLLIVADGEKVLAIAGVMGGELSKVDDKTNNILVEVANFHPEAVAKSGRALNLLSDSRYRFERRIDSGSTDSFVSYLTGEITKNLGGAVVSSTKAFGNTINHPKEVAFNIESVSELAGSDIDNAFIESTLQKLGFIIKGDKVTVPSYRYGDITQGRDLVEEVLRIYGLDNIVPLPIPLSFENISVKSPEFADKARQYLINNGFDEMITYSFISRKQADQFSFAARVELANPISSDMSVMRASQLPSLLKHLSENISYGIHDANYFEIGNIYEGSEPEQQKQTLSAILAGKFMRKTTFKEEREFDFYDAKGYVFSLIKLYGLDPDKCKINRGAPGYYHPGKSAVISLGKNIIGYFGELNFAVLKDSGIETNVAAFELFIGNMPILKTKIAKVRPQLSHLQIVNRDFAFMLEDSVEVGSMLADVKGIAAEVVEGVNVFDIYKGKGVAEGKKSVAFSIALRPKVETFTDVGIEKICGQIVNLVQTKYGGEQR